MAELISPEHLLTMSPQAIEAHLTSLRERRERVRVALRKTTARRATLTKPELGARLEVHAVKLAKALEVVDKALAKAELITSNIIALRLQHGDNTVLTEQE